MSDYLAAQKVISLSYDSIFEVVTKDHQKLQIATSGTVELSRPDKIRTTRKSGFSDTEMVFDGKTLSFLGKGQNAYIQTEAPGTIDTADRPAAGQVPPAAARRRPAAIGRLRRADDRRHRRQGPRQRRDRRQGVRSSRLPRQGHRLADLDRAGRRSPIPAAMSSPARASTRRRNSRWRFATGRPAARRATSASRPRPAPSGWTSRPPGAEGYQRPARKLPD